MQPPNPKSAGQEAYTRNEKGTKREDREEEQVSRNQGFERKKEVFSIQFISIWGRERRETRRG